jgi:hypothetical protein
MFRTAIIMATGSEDRQVSKPRLRTVLLRESLQNCVVTVEILEQAYKATCESLKEERASKVKKVYKYLSEHGDKMLTGFSTVFNMVMQIVQMHVHSVERGEDLATHARERAEDKDPFGLEKLGVWAGSQLKKIHLGKIEPYVGPVFRSVGVALPKVLAVVPIVYGGVQTYCSLKGLPVPRK